jgi:predicted CoA-binding protein
MSDAEQILSNCSSVLLIDWPSAEVPDTLARAGWTVHVKGGPGADDFSLRELHNDAVISRESGHRPNRVDLIYVHRPVAELPHVIDMAREMGVRALWYQSGLTSDGAREARGCWLSQEDSRHARAAVERAGLLYMDDRYIVDVVNELSQNG